jgi:seryl-tRNA synthetase
LRQWQVHHLDKIEARVLTGLKERLVSSEAVAEAVRAYEEEMNRLNRGRRVQATTDQKALAQIEKAIAGIMAAIEDGMYQPSMKARMDDLEPQKAEIVARLTEAPVDMPDVHPNLANLYRLRVERLTDALSDPDWRQAGGGSPSFPDRRNRPHARSQARRGSSNPTRRVVWHTRLCQSRRNWQAGRFYASG